MLNKKLYYLSSPTSTSTQGTPDNSSKQYRAIQNNVQNNSCIVEYLETLIEYHQQQLQKHKTLEMINTLTQEQHEKQYENPIENIPLAQNYRAIKTQADIQMKSPIQNYSVQPLHTPRVAQNNHQQYPALVQGVPVPDQNKNFLQIQDLRVKNGNNIRAQRAADLIPNNNIEVQKLAQLVSLNRGKLSPDVSPRSHFHALCSDADSVISSDISEYVVGGQQLRNQGGVLGGMLPKNMAVVQEDNSQKYKTEICKLWEETGWCRFGSKCHFAHGAVEMKTLSRHPKYKTKVCRKFSETGMCNYGNRCQFLHEQHPCPSTPNPTKNSTPTSTPTPTPAPAPTSSPAAIPTVQHRLPIFQQLADTNRNI